MTRQVLRTAAVLLLVPACCGLAVAQDYYWETVTGIDDGSAPVAKTFYAPKKLKFVSAKEDAPTIIVRMDRGTVLVVNTRRETFAEVSYADWKSMRGQRNAMVFQIPPDVQKLPDEQRERRVRELMATQLSANRNVEVVRGAETKSVRGYSCSKYTVKQENRVVLTVWSTRAVKEFEHMREDLVEAYEQLSLNHPAMRMLPDALRSIDGFPMEYGVGEEKTTVQKIEKRVWGEDVFEAPSGFKRTTPAVAGQQ